jgi:hypothetical protein
MTHIQNRDQEVFLGQLVGLGIALVNREHSSIVDRWSAILSLGSHDTIRHLASAS